MISNKHAVKGLGRKIAAVGMGVALTVTMVGMPVGTAMAASSSSSSSKSKVVKKSTKKTKTSNAKAASMNDNSEDLGLIFARPAEGVQMSGTELGEKAAKVAKKYIGYSYVYGGASPATGFDCSGLTQYVYKTVGVDIWRTAQDQYNYCKKIKNKVKKKDIETGDLLFFGSSTSSISHVGIYVGKGKFVHASTPSTGVKTSKLSQRTNWVAAGRPYDDD